MARNTKQQQQATQQQPTETSAVGTSAWAREKARALAGEGKAGNRFASIAAVLLDAHAEGKQQVSFAAINAATGLHRGEKGDPGQAWRLALTRTRSLVGREGLPPCHVDTEAKAIVFEKAEA